MEAGLFQHQGLWFRYPTKDDLETIRELRNDSSTWIHLTDPRPLGPADQKAWFESLGSRSGKYYFIAFNKDNPFVGLVRMDEHDLLNRSIRVGADVVPSLRGKGYGTWIYAAIKDYCFNELGVHRIWLLVLETNKIGRHVYQKAGFSEEGAYKEAIFRHGRWADYIIMSILEQREKLK